MNPVLYHDIDGIVFGAYGPRQTHQLRPGVADWFHWVLRRYQVVFLTKWTQEDLHALLTQLYLKDVIESSRYLPWFTVGIATKWEAILRDQHVHASPFFWIDDQHDQFPAPQIQAQYFHRLPFVRVNPTGANELADLMQRLQARMQKLQKLTERRLAAESTLAHQC